MFEKYIHIRFNVKREPLDDDLISVKPENFQLALKLKSLPIIAVIFGAFLVAFGNVIE